MANGRTETPRRLKRLQVTNRCVACGLYRTAVSPGVRSGLRTAQHRAVNQQRTQPRIQKGAGAAPPNHGTKIFVSNIFENLFLRIITCFMFTCTYRSYSVCIGGYVWWPTSANLRPKTRHTTPTAQPHHAATFVNVVRCFTWLWCRCSVVARSLGEGWHLWATIHTHLCTHCMTYRYM